VRALSPARRERQVRPPYRAIACTASAPAARCTDDANSRAQRTPSSKCRLPYAAYPYAAYVTLPLIVSVAGIVLHLSGFQANESQQRLGRRHQEHQGHLRLPDDPTDEVYYDRPPQDPQDRLREEALRKKLRDPLSNCYVAGDCHWVRE